LESRSKKAFLMQEKNKAMEIKDFEKSLDRLEKIVAQLENGELALEEAMNLFEEGMKLSDFCGKQLEEVERKVNQLVRKNSSEFVEQPFGEGQDE